MRASILVCCSLICVQAQRLSLYMPGLTDATYNVEAVGARNGITTYKVAGNDDSFLQGQTITMLQGASTVSYGMDVGSNFNMNVQCSMAKGEASCVQEANGESNPIQEAVTYQRVNVVGDALPEASSRQPRRTASTTTPTTTAISTASALSASPASQVTSSLSSSAPGKSISLVQNILLASFFLLTAMLSVV